jgi:hypothetical protein
VVAVLRGSATLLFLALVTLSSDAAADATFALHWRDTGTQTLTILPGDPEGGGQRALDILMTLDVQWIGFGVTVAIPDGSSLGFAGARRWQAVAVPGADWGYVGTPTLLDVDEPLFNLGPYREAYEFVTLMTPPAGPPWAQPGTYVVGSVLLDTSAALDGETIETFFVPGLDGLAIDDGTGSVVYSDDATFLNATLGTAQLFVIPEPAAGALVAVGLLLLGLARRRASRPGVRWRAAKRRARAGA